MCTKCDENPRPSNSPWCRDCRNKQAAEYRERTRPRRRTEERICALDGCDKTYVWESTHPKQLYCCKSHYMKARQRAQRVERPEPPAGMLFCSRCKTLKSRSDFPPSKQGNVRSGWCTPCGVEYGNLWAEENPDRRSASTRRSRAARLLRLYGAPIDDIGALIAQQDGRCKCCGNEPTRGFHIDHDHARHEAGLPSYRGLLCHGCNVGLGAFADDIERLKAAVLYLELDRAA